MPRVGSPGVGLGSGVLRPETGIGFPERRFLAVDSAPPPNPNAGSNSGHGGGGTTRSRGQERGRGQGQSSGGANPAFSNVVLQLAFETTLNDESSVGALATPLAGGASLNADESKFGDKSGLFVPNGRITYPANSVYQIGTKEFCMEAWIWKDNTGRAEIIASIMGTSGNRTYKLSLAADDTIKWTWSFDGTATALLATDALSWSNDVWYHVAVDRDSSNVLRIYRDGEMLKSAAHSGDYFPVTERVFNLASDTGGSFTLEGRMENFRFTIGESFYASDGGYDVPTAVFPTS